MNDDPPQKTLPEQAIAEIDGRRLYVSADGTDRSAWKRDVVLIGLGVFGVGFLAGVLVERK